jgi:hypothetical protein
MLTEIEQKIVERLNLKLAGVSRIAVDEAHSPHSLNLPGVDVIIGGGSFSTVAQKYKIKPTVYVVVTFQNFRSVEERRKGVYPILLSIIALLIGNNFGLKIDGLAPIRLDNITEKEEADDGKIVFQLEFETSFFIESLSDEITDLLTIGLSYYLKPGDETADAADEVATAT